MSATAKTISARLPDQFLVYVPDSKLSVPVITDDVDAILAAMEDLGKHARVRRITEGELARDFTSSFRAMQREIAAA